MQPQLYECLRRRATQLRTTPTVLRSPGEWSRKACSVSSLAWSGKSEGKLSAAGVSNWCSNNTQVLLGLSEPWDMV